MDVINITDDYIKFWNKKEMQQIQSKSVDARKANEPH